MGKSLKLQTKTLALLIPDKGPRSMEISTVYTWQDTEYECETETEQCGVDETHQCDHAEETEQWLSEDFHRQRCEVRARRGSKLCCKILTALGRREWKTWNDVPLELRKDIGRINRNLGHASADQLEQLFRDENVSDDAISALKHFRCDACDRLKQPPSKRKVAVNHAETFNDIVSMDVNFWKMTLQGISSCEDDTEGAEHRGCRFRDAHCDSDCRSNCRDHLESWLRWAGSPRCLRVDPHRSQKPKFSSTKQKDEAYLWNQHRLKHTGRWDRWKTMPGICDKWCTEVLRTLMCR